MRPSLVDESTSVADVLVTPELLRSAVCAIQGAPRADGATLEGCVRSIIEALLEEGIEEQQQLVRLGSAICARLMAFAALMSSSVAGPWLAPAAGPPAASFDSPLLEAMALAPLRLERGRYRFDTDTFFAIVLERAPAAGCG